MLQVIGKDTFKNWDGVFDKIYKIPNAGSIKKIHIFSFSDNTINTVTLTTKTSNNFSSKLTQQFLKLKSEWTPQDRLHNMTDIDAIPLTKPGLSYMKQVQFYSKWRNLLPLHQQDVTCPKPSREIIKQYKRDTKQKNQLKQAMMYPNDNNNKSQDSSEKDNAQANKASTKQDTYTKEVGLLRIMCYLISHHL